MTHRCCLQASLVMQPPDPDLASTSGAVSAEKQQALEAVAQSSTQAAAEREAAAQQLTAARRQAREHAQSLSVAADTRFREATSALRQQIRDRCAQHWVRFVMFGNSCVELRLICCDELACSRNWPLHRTDGHHRLASRYYARQPSCLQGAAARGGGAPKRCGAGGAGGAVHEA